MAKTNRPAASYRAARRNALRVARRKDFGAVFESLLKNTDALKVRPVPASPWLPFAQRQKNLEIVRQFRAKVRELRGNTFPKGVPRRVSKRAAEPFKGKLVLGQFTTLRKAARALRRAGVAA